ncbi:MAG: hypothetical protein MJE63_12680 [Proteobacteria bacterium]|nr:hypothetical protein [Pseudomonadota bacterium]
MSPKKSPAALRAEAKALMKKAKIEEDKLYMNVGRLVEKEFKKRDAFTTDNPTELKAEINALKAKIQKILRD